MLTDFEGVTKTLQRSMLTLSGARCLFDLVCQRYTQLKPRLSPTADIVNYVALETGIVKLQWKEPLTAAERVACADFDVPIVERRRQTFIAVYVGAFVGPASRLKQVRIGNQVLRLLAIPIAFPVTQTRGWSLRLQCSTWSFSLKVQKEYCLNSTQLGS
ncbi:hypothetical protein PC112_g18339 [Phytophthora cactorum]|nr:hypothetical protein PC112_g18339 [Phytophthora cactorum]